MYLEKYDLKGRVAAITGGGQGIGLSCAQALGEAGELQGEVMVVERLGGETFLYTQLAGEGAGMIVIQADGEIPTRAHERIAVRLDPATCHLFDAEGLAVVRAQRHPLADMRRPTAAARKAS